MTYDDIVNHIKRYSEQYWGEQNPHVHDVIYLEILRDKRISKQLYRELLSKNEFEEYYMNVVKLDGVVFGFYEMIDTHGGITGWEFSWNDVFEVQCCEENKKIYKRLN